MPPGVALCAVRHTGERDEHGAHGRDALHAQVSQIPANHEKPRVSQYPPG